jgi:hypothetical protein
MRTRPSVLVACMLCAVVSIAAQQSASAGPEQYAGVWAGTWEGDGSGGIELTLEKPKDGPMIGRISVTGEPTYKATLKMLSFDGAKMTATYDFPPDASAEVAITGTFDGGNVAGAWSVREKASGSEVASGTWKAARK